MRLALALLLLASPLDAQTFVLVSATDSVRRFLADRWDDTKDPAQSEKAFCSRYHFAVGLAGEPFIVLVSADSADTRSTQALGDGRRGITFYCPPETIPVHSHPPSGLNAQGEYAFRGPDANICGPSLRDLRSLKETRSLFGVVQCDRWALVGYSTKLIWPKP